MKRLWERITTANTVTVTVLTVFLALVIGAVLIVLGDEQVLSEYGYFFAAPGTVLADSWALVSDAYANIFKGSIVDPGRAGNVATGGAGC